MPLVYNDPPNSGPLEQGEILADILEHRPLQPPVAIPEDSTVEVQPRPHPLMIVMTAVCDLERDYEARFGEETAGDQSGSATTGDARPALDDNEPRLVPHVLLCELYQHENIRPRFEGASDIWKRIRGNQDERYHHLEPAPIGDAALHQLPDLYLDFKKTFALPTDTLYSGLVPGGVRRVAVIPPVYLHDLIHRFYGFLSRVGVPG